MKIKDECPLLGLVFALKKKCTEMDEQILQELDLHQSELQFFSALGNCEKMTSSILGKEMNLSPSRVSRVIDKLVSKEYLVRQTAANDRRAISLELTKKGNEVLEKINETRRSCETGLIQILSEEESQQFKSILEKINREM